MTDCFVILNNGSGYSHVELPCYPDKMSNSMSANWSDTSIVGRSSPISSYTNTNYRETSFSFTLHRQMSNSFNGQVPKTINSNIETILKCLQASVYPEYSGSGLKPTLATFVFGSHRMHGIIKSVSFSWKKPVIDGKYQVVDVSINLTEVPSTVYGVSDLGNSYNPFHV